MSEISGNSLFVLVQVLDEKITALKLRIEQTSAEDPSIADWEEELLTYSVVAMEQDSPVPAPAVAVPCGRCERVAR
jgi:hypothetical protein